MFKISTESNSSARMSQMSQVTSYKLKILVVPPLLKERRCITNCHGWNRIK